MFRLPYLLLFLVCFFCHTQLNADSYVANSDEAMIEFDDQGQNSWFQHWWEPAESEPCDYQVDYNSEFNETTTSPCVPFCCRPRNVIVGYVVGNVGRGLGFDCDYSTLGLYLSRDSFYCFRPFVDLRWHCFTDRKNAANIGCGIRYLSNNCGREHGVNVFYDFREGFFANYNQLGIGVESLGPCLDFRINAYFPLRCKSTGKKNKTNYQAGFFANSKPMQFSFKGVDVDIGLSLIKSCNFRFYVAGGPYYFTNDLKQRALGGRVRFFLMLYNNMGFEMNATFDSVFHNRLQGKLWVSFPLYCYSRSDRCCPQSSCCCYPEVRSPAFFRNDMIVLNERCCWKFNFCPGDDGCDCGCKN